jgi:general secretion pathway protein C
VVAALKIPESALRALGPLRLFVECALVITLAVSLAKLGWLLAAPQASVAELTLRPLPAPITQQAATTISVDRTLLVKENPFAAEISVEEIAAPATQLNLRLAGLIMSTGEGGGSAQITTPDNRTSRFTIGDEIIPGVELERILSDRIILSRNGESETLLFGSRGKGLSVITDGSQTETDPASGDLETPEGPSVAVSDTLLEGSAQNPDTLFQNFSLASVERAGQQPAFIIAATGSQDIIAASGLQQGDLLLEVNGTNVGELDIAELIDEIGASQAAILNIERAGVQRTLRLRFEE